MPPMPPVGSPAGAPAFSGLSATTASVVRNSAAMDAAFCSAERVTLTGSATPAFSRSSYSPVSAFRPIAGRQVAHLLRDDARLQAGVEGDLLERGLERNLDDVGTGGLVTGQLQLVQHRGRLQQGHAATGDDALLDGGLGVADRVLDAMLALLELHLGGSPGLDHRNTAGQLGQALLQLLAVVVGVAVLDLGTDLRNPAGDGVGITGALDDGGLVLGDDDLARLAEQRDVGGLQGQTDLFADDLATGEDRDVLQHRLAAITEARRLDGNGLEGAADLVDDQRGQRLALDVLGDDQQRLAGLDDLLQQGQQILDGRHLGADQQDVRDPPGPLPDARRR